MNSPLDEPWRLTSASTRRKTIGRVAIVLAWAAVTAPTGPSAQSPVPRQTGAVQREPRLLIENGDLRVFLLGVQEGDAVDLAGMSPQLIVPVTRAARATLAGGNAAAVDADEAVAWSDAPFRTLRCTGGGSAEFLAVEVRRGAPPRPQSPPRDDDATLVAPDIYRLTFDNERVRVLRVHILPGQGSRMHSHAGRDFRYPLTSGALDLIEADGKTTRVALRAGTPRWEEPPAHHKMSNVGDTELRIVLIEVK